MNFSDYRADSYFPQSFYSTPDRDFDTRSNSSNYPNKQRDWQFKGKISYEDYVFAEVDENDFFDDFLPAREERREKEQDSIEEIMILCTFCSESFEIKKFEAHDQSCSKKKVLCDECGQNILINAFSLHIEICKPKIPDNILFEQEFLTKNRIEDPFTPSDDYQRVSNDNYYDMLFESDNQQAYKNGYQQVIDNGNKSFSDQHHPDSDVNEIDFVNHNNNFDHPYQHDIYDGDEFGFPHEEQDHVIPYQPFDHEERVQEEYKAAYEAYSDSLDHDHYDEDQFDSENDRIPQEIDQTETYEELLALDATIVKIGLSKNQLDKFSTRTFLANTNTNTCCSVCLEDYELGDTLKKIKCKHEFHKNCIEEWLKSNITCPVCKSEMR